jgi:hypothetical protein
MACLLALAFSLVVFFIVLRALPQNAFDFGPMDSAFARGASA